MTEFAIVDDGVIVGFKDLPQAPTLAGKPYRQVLPVETTDPAYDPATQVRTGPTLTVEPLRVTRVYAVRSKTAEELDADKEAALTEAEALTAIFKGLFNHENRIRTLAGQATITAAQFRAGLKALL